MLIINLGERQPKRGGMTAEETPQSPWGYSRYGTIDRGEFLPDLLVYSAALYWSESVSSTPTLNCL